MNRKSGRDNSRDILCSKQSVRRLTIVLAVLFAITMVVGWHIEAEKQMLWETTGVWQW